MAGFILLEDNASYILQEDGLSKIIWTDQGSGAGFGSTLQVSTQEVILPARFDDDPDEWLAQSMISIEEGFRRVLQDVTVGAIRHTVVHDVPIASDIEEGMLIFYQSGSTVTLYAKVQGEIKSVSLT